MIPVISCAPKPELVDGTDRPESADGYFEVMRRWDETVYQNEVLARSAEMELARLWDTVRQSPDSLGILSQVLGSATCSFPGLESIDSAWSHLEHFSGIGPRQSWTPDQLATFLQDLASSWSLPQMEIRQVAFKDAPKGGQSISSIHTTFQLVSPDGKKRADFRASIDVHWPVGVFHWDGASLDILSCELSLSHGHTPFRLVTAMDVKPIRDGFLIGPLIVQDINGDQYPEIALPGANKIYWNEGGKSFRPGPLLQNPRPTMLVSAILDLEADGRLDVVAVDGGGLWVWTQSTDGRFLAPPELRWKPDTRIRGGMCLTAGDINGDHLLDLWVGQYKPPYEEGHMPQPFHDANDGEPMFLLQQQSDGQFVDISQSAGLGPLRNRRAFGGSFVDLDQDHALDLVVISDFSGLDLYWNNRDGTFSPDMSGAGDRRYALGMSHCIVDINHNGMPEILMTGMNAPTVDRLNSAKAHPAHDPDARKFRTLMTAGNQWLEWNPQRSLTDFQPTGPWQKTGWTWGVSPFDFDNDGFLDLFITNGHESAASTRDYETYFWCYDIFFGRSDSDPAVHQFFDRSMAQTRGHGLSYGGYEINRVLKSNADNSLIEVAHHLGLASQLDSRAAVAADFDLDGAMDLACTTFEFWPRLRQQLQIYRNAFVESEDQHWVGFIHDPSTVPPGSVISVRTSENSPVQRRWMILGESYRSQHPWVSHFGTGSHHGVVEAQILKPDGSSVRRQFNTDSYHSFSF